MLRFATILLSTVLLCGCITSNPPSDVVFPAGSAPSAQAAPATEPAPAAQADATPAPKPAAPTRAPRGQPAGRATSAPPPATESGSGDDGPMTVTKAREQCWMLSETDKSVRGDLDKKVKYVESCVDKKMNASIGR